MNGPQVPVLVLAQRLPFGQELQLRRCTGGDNIRARAEHKVKVIGKTGKAEQVDAHARSQSFQFVLDPDFSMLEVFS